MPGMANPATNLPPLVVIDASPVMNLLGLHFSRVQAVTPEVRERRITGDTAKQYLGLAPDRQDNFLQLFDAIPSFTTTSHVVGELQGLSHNLRLNETEKKAFWRTSAEFVRAHRFDERLVGLLELD